MRSGYISRPRARRSVVGHSSTGSSSQASAGAQSSSLTSPSQSSGCTLRPGGRTRRLARASAASTSPGRSLQWSRSPRLSLRRLREAPTASQIRPSWEASPSPASLACASLRSSCEQRARCYRWGFSAHVRSHFDADRVADIHSLLRADLRVERVLPALAGSVAAPHRFGACANHGRDHRCESRRQVARKTAQSTTRDCRGLARDGLRLRRSPGSRCDELRRADLHGSGPALA